MTLKEFISQVGQESCELATVNVLINGEQKEIIPAFTKFSINRRDFSRSTTFENIDSSKVLPTIFAFAKPTAFQNENVVLYDYYGTKIPQEFYEHVLVYLDKADNINLFGVLNEPLRAEIISCDSVSEAYSYVATSLFLSQCPTKYEWLGLAQGTTKDNVLMQILEFANEHKMNGTVAQAYFGLSYKVSSLQKAAVTMIAPHEDVEYRTKEEALELFNTAEKTFGTRHAVQTRYAKALNASIHIYSLDEVLEALKHLDESDVDSIKTAKSDMKSQTLQSRLAEKITVIRNYSK